MSDPCLSACNCDMRQSLLFVLHQVDDTPKAESVTTRGTSLLCSYPSIKSMGILVDVC